MFGGISLASRGRHVEKWSIKSVESSQELEIMISFNFNRPFYRYGSHIELSRFKEYYRMPGGHKHDPVNSLRIYARFSGQFFLKLPRKRLSWEKRSLCRV